MFFDFSPILDKILLVYTVVVVMVIWEALDKGFQYFESRNYNFTRSRNLVKVIVVFTLMTLPLVAAASFISEYYIKPLLECPVSDEAFYDNIVHGQVIGWLIIAAKIIKVNTIQNQQLEKDKAMVQKELLQSKYQNLKNQINPHFLFNSLSVLQNLIETDPHKANEFVDNLSSMYRYILENREESMSSVERELGILEVYLFLLKTRHEDSLSVEISVGEEYYQSFIPTLSLQLLIENAVKHNKFSHEQPLSIKVFVENDHLVVQNKLKKKGSTPTSTKIGLENIRKQYSLQTDRSVIVTEDEEFFTVKLPVLFGLRLT